MKNTKEKLGLYIHIPFCVKKCAYCDFLSAPATRETKQRYFAALLDEIESYRNRLTKYSIATVFFGGGTPSSAEGNEILKVMKKINDVFELEDYLEVTIEVNPGTITREKFLKYQEAGINRLSFGLQSANNEELRLLGRIHTFEEFVDNYRMAREIGFQNINIDLMSALPGQTLASWENTLNRVLELQPEHISAYSLIIEEGTEFFERYQEGTPGFHDLPDEENDRRMYHLTGKRMEQYGYTRYEISNYAKPGYECIHNSSYWKGTQYLGLGLGAASLINNIRFSKERDINQYLGRIETYKVGVMEKPNEQKPASESSLRGLICDSIGLAEDIEELTLERRMEEFMFLGLRMCKGVSKDEFGRRFSCGMDQVYGDKLHQLQHKGLITMEADRIKLTKLGIDVSNTVLAEFLLD